MLFRFTLISTLGLFLFPPPSFAHEDLDKILDPKYSCELVFFSTDSSVKIDNKFVAESDNGSHGGPEQLIKAGDFTIGYIADRQFLGLTWMKGDTVVAKGLAAVGPEGSNNRVLILYNPQNDEQVSLNCSKIEATPTN